MSDTMTRRFKAAVERLRAGDAAEAERILLELVAERPNHAAAWHVLGLIAGRSGRDSDCVAWLVQAFERGDEAQRISSGIALAEAHRRAARPAEAEAVLNDLADASPENSDVWLRLGLLLQLRGDAERSVAALRRTLFLAPDLAVAHGALASALLATGAIEEAAGHALEALTLCPDDPGFIGNLATVRNAEGRFDEAAKLCRRALASRDDPLLLNTLGIALKETDGVRAAGECFERALALRPGYVDALYNLADVYRDEGRTADAVALLRTVIARAPDNAAARFALCMAHLPPLYENQHEIDDRRSDYEAELDALIAHADIEGAAGLASGVGAAQPFYLAYQGRDDVAPQHKYGALVCRAMQAAHGFAPIAGPPAPGERIRVGIVSGYIRDHSVWRLPTRGWVDALDRKRFELFGYHTGASTDAETDRARRVFDHFVQGPLPTEEWLRRISGDRPHALIYPEIGMDPMVARLAGLRLARVQYASWGHPSTTGYPTIDYFLSSELMEPEHADAHYTETLVRLPGLSTPLTFAPEKRDRAFRAHIGWPEDAVVYWCGQSLYKYLPAFDAIYPQIAARVPDSRFIFLEFSTNPALARRFRQRLVAAFGAAGADAEEHCIFLPRMTPKAYRHALASADVVLDSLGWSGCNSTVDALTFNLPIVTLAGSTMRSRHGKAILSLLSLDSFVCRTIQAYIDLAVGLGRDSGARSIAISPDAVRTLELENSVRALEQHIIYACDGRPSDGAAMHPHLSKVRY